jgi:hypothetical protein
MYFLSFFFFFSRSLFRKKTVGCVDGLLNNDEWKIIARETKLTAPQLAEVWRLADVDRDEKLTFAEFVMSMHLLKVNLFFFIFVYFIF